VRVCGGSSSWVALNMTQGYFKLVNQIKRSFWRFLLNVILSCLKYILFGQRTPDDRLELHLFVDLVAIFKTDWRKLAK
jgi:hypothetical protein